LNRQLEGILEKDFIHHNLSPCVVSIMLTHKNHGS